MSYCSQLDIPTPIGAGEDFIHAVRSILGFQIIEIAYQIIVRRVDIRGVNGSALPDPGDRRYTKLDGKQG